MKIKFRSAGFSLIELLITVAVFGIVFIVIARVMLTTVKSDTRLTEQSEAQDRNGIISDVLQKDFAQPLRLLSSLAAARSGTSLIAFEPNADYESRPGEAVLTRESGGEWLQSSLILKDGGAVAGYAPPADSGSMIGWRTVSGTRPQYVAVQISPPQKGAGRSFTVISTPNDDGIIVGTGAGVGGGNVERTGTIGESERIEARVERLSIGCRIGFFSVWQEQLTLLARSNKGCPPGPLEVVAAAEESGALLSQINMSGSFEDRSGTVRTAPLPYVQTARISVPIFTNPENGDLVLFRAEDATGKTFTLADASFQPYRQTRITVVPPARGVYAADDFIFLVDYAQALSVVLHVVSVDVSTATVDSSVKSQALIVEPVFTASAAAWGLFYSPPPDFTSAPFTTGAEVVQLAPPVIYRYLNATKILVRREGTGLFQTVAPGVAGFNTTISSGTLNVEILASTEGIETSAAQPVQTTRLSIPIN